MHTYDFHIGDYSRDTGHLSLLEHGVYRLLLDRAYSDEAPLTANTALLIRKLGAKTAAEQKAVETILTEFFTQTPEGWIHKRVQQELEEARGRSLKSKHSQVLRWWRHNKWPNEPTLLDYMQNPAAYHDPITGHIRQPNNGNTVVYEPNSYQPPTANRQPPTATKENTPLIPQGGNPPSLIASGSITSAPLTETPSPQHDKSEAIASPEKKKGGRARLTQPQFPPDLPEAYHAPLTAWFHHKRLTGKGYVETGWTALVTRERAFTPAQVAASVQASMANGYTGLFTADLAAKATSAPQKKEMGAAPVAQPIITPEWDWLAVANTLWPNHNLHRQRWQDLPASTRHDLRQAHQKHLPA